MTWITNSPLYQNGCIQVVFFVLLIGCIKHCDMIIEYSRILLLNLRADCSWGRRSCQLMKLCPSKQIWITTASKLKRSIFQVGQKWQTQFYREKQGTCIFPQYQLKHVKIQKNINCWWFQYRDFNVNIRTKISV